MDSSSDALRNLGQQLKRLRINAGLTQVQLAQHLDISQTTVSTCEKGSTPTTTDLLLRWVALCGGNLSLNGPEEVSRQWVTLQRVARKLDTDDMRRLTWIAYGMPFAPYPFKEGASSAFMSFAEKEQPAEAALLAQDLARNVGQ